MSKFEPETKINYEGMDEKLKARRHAFAHTRCERLRGASAAVDAARRAQVIRKRLNKPLTLAEKARARRAGEARPQGSGLG